jgi:hypothetical protein
MLKSLQKIRDESAQYVQVDVHKEYYFALLSSTTLV